MQHAASTALDGILEEEEREDEEELRERGDEGSVRYDTNGVIIAYVTISQVRRYFAQLKERYRDPVGFPQEWLELVVSNKILKVWTTDPEPTAPPKGWMQDGWGTHTPEELKDQYALNLC